VSILIIYLFIGGVVYDVAKSFVEDILVRKISGMGMGSIMTMSTSVLDPSLEETTFT
jgi:hypothetical protein